SNPDIISPLMKLDVSQEDIVEMDFTENNSLLKDLDVSNTDEFNRYIEQQLDNFKRIGIGGYGEDRFIYRRSTLFDGEKEPRSIHLGIDIWVPAGTEVYAPLDTKVHSFQYNGQYGDYGGTIILEHRLEEVVFYTLYGHLSAGSLEGLSKGRAISKGTAFATIGAPEENGQWPPHLHFQLITDMLGMEGDFYGVAPPSEKEYFMDLCPDPRLLLVLK
ncbi:MAG TPA: peptidoglycan DD-metalloendopeptidase family protein, partial [Bacteroidales bacterium]|nr:peptidoglycan DD-metalloendopeptidase family protein [Bacteroidales bacterium]